ncbi:response regulator [Thermotoga sp.]|uniref:response regulator n=1 Tax=Thermotoga sp. TaxID=28240 RepID=UPI0025D24746|nr:response regulator [Thermotoga sp.]MCD6551628.1 response regulator [Thermotoga sp.]
MAATVMVVDESKITFLAVKNALEKEGCRVLWARNGQEAISNLRREHVDLVFVDIFEGEKSLNLIREIRESFPNTKVAVLSAYVDKDLVVNSVKAGAIDYILKPFKQDYFLGRVKRILSSPGISRVSVSVRRNIEDLEITLRFEDIVRKEIKRCSRAGGHFCIMYVRFNGIMRDYEAIKKFFRETDYILPISASEYVFVLTLTGKHGITAVTRRMKEKLSQSFEHAYVCYPDDGKTYEEFILLLKNRIAELGGK